mmetsp:Transcript_17016/g.43492  ORF Transcript_17016/g.43492 Transcript_17016/m.43492 type:complete len:254 (-) Transcript_17016:116-877(-)
MLVPFGNGTSRSRPAQPIMHPSLFLRVTPSQFKQSNRCWNMYTARWKYCNWSDPSSSVSMYIMFVKFVPVACRCRNGVSENDSVLTLSSTKDVTLCLRVSFTKKSLMTRYGGEPPCDVPFVVEPHGKPSVSYPSAGVHPSGAGPCSLKIVPGKAVWRLMSSSMVAAPRLTSSTLPTAVNSQSNALCPPSRSSSTCRQTLAFIPSGTPNTCAVQLLAYAVLRSTIPYSSRRSASKACSLTNAYLVDAGCITSSP